MRAEVEEGNDSWESPGDQIHNQFGDSLGVVSEDFEEWERVKGEGKVGCESK